MGNAWFDVPQRDGTAHKQAECSNRVSTAPRVHCPLQPHQYMQAAVICTTLCTM